MENKRVLILNMGKFMKPLIELLRSEPGCEIIIADSVENAVQKLKEQRIHGAIISFHPEVNPDTSMGISSGLEMWRRVLRKVDESARTIPIVITVESGFFNTTIEMQIKRYGISNPYHIISGKEFNNEILSLVKKHLGLQ